MCMERTSSNCSLTSVRSIQSIASLILSRHVDIHTLEVFLFCQGHCPDPRRLLLRIIALRRGTAGERAAVHVRVIGLLTVKSVGLRNMLLSLSSRDEICCMKCAWLFRILFVVEVIEHPIIGQLGSTSALDVLTASRDCCAPSMLD